jgi:hypothetical protein
MPTTSVYSIAPVYTVVSSIPSIAGAAGLAAVAADTGTDGGPTALVTFAKAAYTQGSHGGSVPAYSNAVTMLASVTRKNTPVVITPGSDIEPRATSSMLLEVTTDEDPGALLGSPLVTNDRVEWAGKVMTVVGTALPQGSGYITDCLLVT